jgi:hypothetical protein
MKSIISMLIITSCFHCSKSPKEIKLNRDDYNFVFDNKKKVAITVISGKEITKSLDIEVIF